MANIVVVSAVKRLAKNLGKRLSPSYVAYLNRRVTEIIGADCRSLGSHKTLNAEDAAAKEMSHSLVGR